MTHQTVNVTWDFFVLRFQRKKGGMVKNYKALFGSMIVLFALAGQQAFAQSTLFNIPSTDAVSAKKVYAEFDFFAQMPTTEGVDRLYVYVPRGVVGVGSGIEAGANVGFFHTASATQSYF